VTVEQKLSPVLKPLFRIFKVSNLEDLIKRLLKLVFTLVLLIPLILLPLYFFFFTLLHF
jgi:flagellar biosynthesis protein FlhB